MLTTTQPPVPEPLELALRRYQAANVASGCTPATVRARLLVVKMLQDANDGIDPREATNDDVAVFLARPNMHTAKPLSVNSRATYYRALTAWYRWLVETDRIDRSPMRGIAKPRVPRAMPHPISEPDLARAIAGAESKDMLAWLLLGAYQGLRVHEIAKVRGSDFADGMLLVDGKGGKVARLAVHPRVDALRELYSVRDYWFNRPWHYLSGDHVTPKLVGTAVAKYLRSIGIDATAHSLRHRYGTQVLRSSGGNLRIAQEALRHSSVATTQIYTRVEDIELGAAICSLP